MAKYDYSDVPPERQAAIEVALAIGKQRLRQPVLWYEGDHMELWVTRSKAGHTIEQRPKPGSPAALEAERAAQIDEARAVLADPTVDAERMLWALRVAALAVLDANG